MRARFAVVLFSALVPASAHAQRVPDWKAVEAEAISTIQSYVRINTSNPPGDVTKAADFLGINRNTLNKKVKDLGIEEGD